MNEKPVLVWQRGELRIVALHDEDGDPKLAFERREIDALGADAWVDISTDDSLIEDAISILILELASHNEILPSWVRDYVHQCLEILDASTRSAPGGAA